MGYGKLCNFNFSEDHNRIYSMNQGNWKMYQKQSYPIKSLVTQAAFLKCNQLQKLCS